VSQIPDSAKLEAHLGPVLDDARRWGFLGPGLITQHVTHSLAFLALFPASQGMNLDLGSGGGVPGLVLAAALPTTRWILLDAQQRRTIFLAEAAARLGLEDRVEVRCQRAEEAGRGLLRGTVDTVVARGFSGPAATAECAAPFLRLDGVLIVAEPPGAPERWPSTVMGELGLAEDGVQAEPIALRRFVQRTLCPDRFPRRNGLPRKRPLF
jgi:16S rRNA (guanine527-N7)-methyltransferase